MRVVCIYFEKSQDTQSLAEIFYRYTPQIMLRGDRAIFLEISKCRALYSEQSFVNRTIVTLKKLNLRARVTVANDIPTSLAFAAYETNDEVELPLESLAYFFDPFLNNIEGSQSLYKMITTLKDLGVLTLVDFLNLPPKEISNRFGTLGIMALLKAKGDYPVSWELFKPLEIVMEKCEFDLESPAEILEPIYFRMKPLLDKLILRLRGKNKRLKQFDLILKQEHGDDPDYKISILLQLPYISNKVIFQITKEKLDHETRAKPLKHRVTEFSLIVTEDAPYSMNQKNIFDQKKEENDESLFHLVSRVATKIGSQAIFFAKIHESYLPEKNWKRVQELKPSTPVLDSLPERPLRLLPQPIPVRFLDNKVLYSKFCEEVETRTNKEVVLADWWDSPLERVYYKLSTTAGKELWIFKNNKGHFLHGMFD